MCPGMTQTQSDALDREGGRAERGVEAGEPAEARETQRDRRT